MLQASNTALVQRNLSTFLQATRRATGTAVPSAPFFGPLWYYLEKPSLELEWFCRGAADVSVLHRWPCPLGHVAVDD